MEDSIIRQKSRVLWSRKGDKNTFYFHNSMKSRFWKNYIAQLYLKGKIISEPSQVKVEAANVFSGAFQRKMDGQAKN